MNRSAVAQNTSERVRQHSLATRVAKWYLSLSPAYPPAYYTKPVPMARAKEEYEDELNSGCGFLRWFADKIDIRSKCILDLGSGYGGRTLVYKQRGAIRAVGLEIGLESAREGRQFAASRSSDASFVVAVGEKMPFEDNSFDLILSYDVFEHVEDVGEVLRESWRVLRPGGTLYAVFPPFYHPEGSHFAGYVSKMPYPNLLFSCSTLTAAADMILRERKDGYRPHALRPKDRLATLNGVTIRSFRKLVEKSNFSQRELSFAPLLSPMNRSWGSLKMKYYAFLFRPLPRLPVVKELFTHRIVCELTK